MSDLDYDDLDFDPAQLEYTGGSGWVTSVNGRPPMHRSDHSPGGGQMEWTTFDRQPPYRTDTTGRSRAGAPAPAAAPRTATRPADTGEHSQYWKARRRAELAMERRRHPDFAVYGCAVPYKIKLPGGRDDTLVFSIDTCWLLPTKTMMLRTEHSGFAGNFEIDETPGGLYAHGVILGGLRRLVGDRSALSPALTVIDHDRRPDGTLDVRTARLFEVSLVRRPGWAPHTSAIVFQRAAA